MRSTTRLRQMLAAPGIIVAPGAYDGISARLIEAAGFRAVYMTGAGTAASHLGQPDLGLATLTEMANHAGHLASCVSLPSSPTPTPATATRSTWCAPCASTSGRAWPACTSRTRSRPRSAGTSRASRSSPRGVRREDPRRRRAPHRSRLRDHRPDRCARGHQPRRRDRARQPLRRGRGRRHLRRGTAERGRDPPRRARGPGAAAREHGGGRPHPAVKVSELERLGFKIAIFPAVCMGAAIPAMERALAHLKDRETDWPDEAPRASVPDGHLPQGRLRLVERHRAEVPRRLSRKEITPCARPPASASSSPARRPCSCPAATTRCPRRSSSASGFPRRLHDRLRHVALPAWACPTPGSPP